MQLVDAGPATLTQEPNPRKTRGFCKLQTAVNRYLDDSGYWIDHVSDVLRQLRRLAKEYEDRERDLAERERLLQDRELAVDRLLQQLNGMDPAVTPSVSASEHAASFDESAESGASPAAQSSASKPEPATSGSSPRSRFDAERKRRQTQR